MAKSMFILIQRHIHRKSSKRHPPLDLANPEMSWIGIFQLKRVSACEYLFSQKTSQGCPDRFGVAGLELNQIYAA